MNLRFDRSTGWALAGILFVAGPVAAQVRPAVRDPRQNRRLAAVQVQGTIHSLRPGTLRVVSDDNDRWLVQVARDTWVNVQGRADVRMLQPGRFVRFHAEFDRRGQAREAVEQLTVFDPDQGIRPGVVAAPPDDSETKAADLEGAGRSDQRRSRNTARGRRSRTRRDARQREQRPDVETRRMFVVGQIRGFRQGVLNVLIGRGKAVTVEVNESARVMVETKDYGVARSGDRIRLKGRFAGPGKLAAREIEIKLSAPNDTPPQAGDPENAAETETPPPQTGDATPSR